MSARGYFVYASGRTKEELDALNRLPNVEAVKLDVTIPSDIEAALYQVKKGGRGLYGLVNNAGIAVLNPMTRPT